jgi:hypothetical protein
MLLLTLKRQEVVHFLCEIWSGSDVGFGSGTGNLTGTFPNGSTTLLPSTGNVRNVFDLISELAEIPTVEDSSDSYNVAIAAFYK